jgi:transcriptional regulator with XRE-family HTH domain
MTDISDISLIAATDSALIGTLGSFIRHHRLQQNKSQGQLAGEAGIARSTLSLFEKEENTSLLVFIQLLRVLKLLDLLEVFRVKERISPLLLAKQEQSKRLRARKSGTKKEKSSPESDW